MTDVRMSLAEAAAAFGVPVNTLRSRFKAGKVRGERDNAGKLWVWIDPAAKLSKSKLSNSSKQVRNDGEIEALKGHVETLKSQLAQAEARADEWKAKAEAAESRNWEFLQRSWWDRLLGR